LSQGTISLVLTVPALPLGGPSGFALPSSVGMGSGQLARGDISVFVGAAAPRTASPAALALSTVLADWSRSEPSLPGRVEDREPSAWDEAFDATGEFKEAGVLQGLASHLAGTAFAEDVDKSAVDALFTLTGDDDYLDLFLGDTSAMTGSSDGE
jgi:hypothetical protein